MKLNESDLKSLIKEVVRECVKEACDGGHLAGGAKGKRMFKHIKTGYKGEKDPEDAKHIAAATVNKQLGEDGKEKKGTDVKKAMKLNPAIVKTGDKGKMKMGEKPSMLKKEAGAISQEEDQAGHDYDEGEEVKLIKLLNLVTKKLLKMHGNEGMAEYASGFEQEENKVEEGGPQYKQVAPRQARVQKDNHAFTVQSEPKMTEASHKVVSPRQARVQKDNHALKVQTDPKMTEAAFKKQVRSYTTINDAPQNPENVADPEVPQP